MNLLTRVRFFLVGGVIIRHLLRISCVHVALRDRRSFPMTKGKFVFLHLKPLCFLIESCSNFYFHVIF